MYVTKYGGISIALLEGCYLTINGNVLKKEHNMYQHQQTSIGDHELYLHQPNKIPTLIAKLSVIDSNKIINASLPFIFKHSENSFLVPIDSKCTATAGFSDGRVNKFSFLNDRVPFVKQEVRKPLFEAPVKVKLSEQQRYL